MSKTKNITEKEFPEAFEAMLETLRKDILQHKKDIQDNWLDNHGGLTSAGTDAIRDCNDALRDIDCADKLEDLPNSVFAVADGYHY